MASTEFWMPWRNTDGPHCAQSYMNLHRMCTWNFIDVFNVLVKVTIDQQEWVLTLPALPCLPWKMVLYSLGQWNWPTDVIWCKFGWSGRFRRNTRRRRPPLDGSLISHVSLVNFTVPTCTLPNVVTYGSLSMLFFVFFPRAVDRSGGGKDVSERYGFAKVKYQYMSLGII